VSSHSHVYNIRYHLLTRITRPGLPKKFQTFLFFRIRKPEQFKERLKAFVPEITSAARAVQWKETIFKEKKLHPKDNLPGNLRARVGVNIAFASTGLAAVSCDAN
jgi:hypothetical protein